MNEKTAISEDVLARDAEIARLREQVSNLEKQKRMSRGDRLKLAIIDRAPFTIWASDRNMQILLWGGACAKVYGFTAAQAIGKNYLELFVDPPERKQSREDALKIIDEDVEFTNFIAYDVREDGGNITMLTNCMRVYDDEIGGYVQAELGLDISDLELAKDKWRKLREVGIAFLKDEEQRVLSDRNLLARRIQDIRENSLFNLGERKRQLQEWRTRIQRETKSSTEIPVITSEMENIEEAIVWVKKQSDLLADLVKHASSAEELSDLALEVDAYASGLLLQLEGG